jgi:hypothetical protein
MQGWGVGWCVRRDEEARSLTVAARQGSTGNYESRLGHAALSPSHPAGKGRGWLGRTRVSVSPGSVAFGGSDPPDQEALRGFFLCDG